MKIIYSYSIEYHSALNEYDHKIYMKWTNLKCMILGKVTSQKEKIKHVLPHMWNLINTLCMQIKHIAWMWFNV